MNNDNLFVGAVAVVFLVFIVVMAYTNHTEKMKCMELRGNWQKGACVFMETK